MLIDEPIVAAPFKVKLLIAWIDPIAPFKYICALLTVNIKLLRFD